MEMGLALRELAGETMSYAMELIPRYTGASRNDCFALALAAQEGCTLLTGDKALRNAAESEQVMVRGTLWLVELMVRQELIGIERALSANEGGGETFAVGYSGGHLERIGKRYVSIKREKMPITTDRQQSL